MPKALWWLLWMKVYSGVRRAVRVQGNPKKLVLLVVGMGAIGFWLVSVTVLGVRSQRTPSEFFPVFGPLALAAFTAFTLLASSGETAIAFLPAEVDTLFPGPFTRRQLLAYKMLSGMVGSLVGAVIFSLLFMPHAGSWPTALVGFILALWFMQFLGTGLALVKQLCGEMAYTRFRRGAIMLVLTGAAVIIALAFRGESIHNAKALVISINESPVGRVLLWPFAVFTNILGSRSLGDALPWIGIACGLNALGALLVLRLDTDYLEASIRASERHAARLRRARSGNIFAPGETGGKPIRSRTARMPSWMGGAAPIAWRQSTTLARGGKKWVFQLTIMLVFAGVLLYSMRRVEQGNAADWVGAGVLLYVTVILAAILRFDFRADLDHIETLKSLPLSPRSITVGELLVPALLLAAVQSIFIVVISVMIGWPRLFVVVAGLTIPAANMLILGVENLLFLAFPARLNNRGVADFSLMGRQMLMFLGKALVYLVVIGVSGGAAAGVYFLTDSVLGAIATAWMLLACAATGVVLGVARVFRAFDVSADMPA